MQAPPKFRRAVCSPRNRACRSPPGDPLIFVPSFAIRSRVQVQFIRNAKKWRRPARRQLPIPIGVDLLLTSCEYVLRRDVTDRAVEAGVVVMRDVAIHQTPCIVQRRSRLAAGPVDNYKD